jgi:1-acyl-sn-glycerol-3-phosphate acyltransferase
LLNRLGCIPKTKFLSDSAAARAMINVKKNGGIIGIFPEGARSWDGHILPLIYSTAKLVKLLKVDVIGARLDGAMFTKPRWSRFRKKGPTFLSYFKILDAADIPALDTNQIYDHLSQALYYDEYEFQRKHTYTYRGKNRAERLERLLYVCPSCGLFHRMNSKKHIFFCTACSFRVEYDEHGFFTGSDVIFDDVRKWSRFQHDRTLELVSGPFEFEAKLVFMSIGSKGSTKLRSLKLGNLIITNKSVNYINFRKQLYKFDPEKLSGLNIQSNHKLEFYQENVFYRLDFAKSNVSAYAVKKILSLLGKGREAENG